jgi:hypothetical protein
MDQTELTEINMQSAIVHSTGLKSMGMLGTVVPGAAPAAAPPAPSPAPAPSTVLPPHVRPSAPPAPPAAPPNGNQPQRVMTENHRRIMREQGFKSEEGILAVDGPAGELRLLTQTSVTLQAPRA